MLHLYIYSFLAGAIGVNGVPHFIKGVTGQKHQTPFGKPSTAVVNVIWGWLNLVIGMVLLHFAHPRLHELRAFGFLAVGALLSALFLSNHWSKYPASNRDA